MSNKFSEYTPEGSIFTTKMRLLLIEDFVQLDSKAYPPALPLPIGIFGKGLSRGAGELIVLGTSNIRRLSDTVYSSAEYIERKGL
jgi:hypothetical protein